MKVFTAEEKKARRELNNEIKSNLNIVEVASSLYGLTMIGSRKGQRYLKTVEHGSMVFDLQKNFVYWNKNGGKPMNVFDFVAAYENIGSHEAIEKVIEYYIERDPNIIELFHYEPLSADSAYITQGLELPEPYQDNKIAINYLLENRRISEHIVNSLLEKGMLYEDKYHNCVFVGEDFEGKQRFACKRGTIPSIKYQRDCVGSYKKCGYFVENKYPVKKLVITESVIDALSYLSLNPNLIDAHVLGSSGAGSAASTLWYNYATRDCLKNIETIVTIFDNDAAGRNAHESIVQWVKQNNKNIDVVPFDFKDANTELHEGFDINDYLIALRESEDRKEIKKQIETEKVNQREDLISINQTGLEKIYGKGYYEKILQKLESMNTKNGNELAMKTTNTEILKILSFSENSRIRMSVAENMSCPIEILERLSQDESNLVQNSVAKNYNCPIDILYQLTLNPSSEVKESAWNNANKHGISSLSEFVRVLEENSQLDSHSEEENDEPKF